MNTTDYFTYVNAMFLFCIFTCGLLVWAVIRGYILKGKLLKEQDSHLKATNTNTLLNKALSAKNEGLQANEHKLREAEKEIRELQAKLTESEKQANGYKAEFIAVSNELEATKAKVRKRDANGKFLPSGNGRVRTPKKLKLVTDLGENEVIHCKTAKQRLAIRTLMHEAGLKWATRHSYMDKEFFSDYGKNLYYMPSNGTHGDIDAVFEGLVIHPASDFIARPKRVKKVKSESPKLVHGLTVKNPTEDEAKMIFDEAKRLGLSTYAEHRIDLPFIWWSVIDTVSRCADSDWPVEQIFVTAKEFVQRMQNGRG